MEAADEPTKSEEWIRVYAQDDIAGMGTHSPSRYFVKRSEIEAVVLAVLDRVTTAASHDNQRHGIGMMEALTVAVRRELGREPMGSSGVVAAPLPPTSAEELYWRRYAEKLEKELAAARAECASLAVRPNARFREASRLLAKAIHPALSITAKGWEADWSLVTTEAEGLAALVLAIRNYQDIPNPVADRLAMDGCAKAKRASSHDPDFVTAVRELVEFAEEAGDRCVCHGLRQTGKLLSVRATKVRAMLNALLLTDSPEDSFRVAVREFLAAQEVLEDEGMQIGQLLPVFHKRNSALAKVRALLDAPEARPTDPSNTPDNPTTRKMFCAKCGARGEYPSDGSAFNVTENRECDGHIWKHETADTSLPDWQIDRDEQGRLVSFQVGDTRFVPCKEHDDCWKPEGDGTTASTPDRTFPDD